MRRAGVSERRACDQVSMVRGTYRYQGKGAADEPMVRGLIRELAQLRPRCGSPRLSALVRRELGPVNHQRVERIYAQEGLQLPRRRKGRRRGVGRVVPLAALTGPNQRWSMDFVQDSTAGGRRIRALTIVDQFTRGVRRLRWTHRSPVSAWSGCWTGSVRPTDYPRRWCWTTDRS